MQLWDIKSFLDAFSGYNQIPLTEQDQIHTSFVTNQCLYSYRVISFGLKNVRANYQKFVNMVLKDKIGSTVEVYIDDMVVKSTPRVTHLQSPRCL